MMFRLAVVGCGRVFSRYHLRAVRSRPDVRIVGAVETDADRLDRARAELPGAECGSDLVELLDGVEIDGVLITTPPVVHAEVAVACLERGLPVLVEKPMAPDLSAAQRIVDAQARSGTPLFVGFNRRFYGAYRALRPRVAAASPELEIEYRFIAEQGRWGKDAAVRDPARVLDDIGCHAMDLLSFLTGSLLRELRASALAGPDGADTYEVKVRLDSGVRARCVVGHGDRYEEWLDLITTRGTHRVRIAGGGAGVRLLQGLGLVVRRVSGAPTVADRAFAAQLQAFLSACGGGPSSDAAGPSDGLAAVRAVKAAEASLESDEGWHPVNP